MVEKMEKLGEVKVREINGTTEAEAKILKTHCKAKVSEMPEGGSKMEIYGDDKCKGLLKKQMESQI